MARTYRKVLCYTSDSPNHKRFAKRQASKKVRKIDPEFIIPDGKAYRMFYNPYDIVDAISLTFSLQEIEVEYHMAFMRRLVRMYRRAEIDMETPPRWLEDLNARYDQYRIEFIVATGTGRWR